MTAAAWQLLIDINKDNLFNHARSDLSVYVLAAQWENGMGNSYEDFASPARMTVTLDNSGGDFDPERPAAAYYGLITRGQHVRLRATFNSTTYTMFDGVVTAMDIDVGVYSPKQVKLVVEDYMLALLDAEYSPPLQTDVRVDEVIRQMLGTGIVALPYARNHWVLDYSELGTNTILVDEDLIMSLETGIAVLEYAGDMTGSAEGTSAQRFLREIVAAEMGGRFFYDAKVGLFVFHSRQSFVGRTSSFALTEADLDRAKLNTGIGDIINDVTVAYTPRISLGVMVVYSSPSAFRLDPYETRVIKARYRDASGSLQRIGVITGIQPVLGTDYISYNNAEIGQENDPSWVAVTATFGGTEATIIVKRIQPWLGYDIWVRAIQLRGTAVGQYEQASLNRQDADSIGAYERQAKQVTLKIGSYVDAEAYAQWMLNEWSVPRPRLERVTFVPSDSDTLMTHALARRIGEVGTVSLASQNHDQEYELVGEQHRLVMGGEHTLTTTWILKPIRRGWQLQVAGYGELDQTTYVGF